MNYDIIITKSDGLWIAKLIEIDILGNHPNNEIETKTAKSFPELQTKISGFVEKTNKNI